MAILRSEIETTIQNYVNRTDLAAYVGTWFSIAHREIQRPHDFKFQETSVDITIVNNQNSYNVLNAGGAATDLKTPWNVQVYNPSTAKLGAFYTMLGFANVLDRRTLDDLNAEVLESGGIAGIWAGNLEVWPTPGTELAGQKFRLYYCKWLPVPATTASDWLTDNARDVLLYRALIETAPFLKEDPRITMWFEMFERANKSFLGPEIASKHVGPLLMRG